MKKKTVNSEKDRGIEFPDQKIYDVQMGREVKKSFIDYAMSVIMARALPDARDGLKPVHRRILYAMYEDHLTSDKPFHKSAATVGNVLGRYHPHGDVAVYDAMVRLAQPFSLRYPLIEGHGNFGNIDGDQAAAYRYTEARLAKLSDELLRDIKKETIDWTPNFDNKLMEPSVLPSRFPNLLVNGSVGIAVGMATNIPPHNMGEVCDAINLMMDNPDVTTDELMTHLPGPDFPTGALILGTQGIRRAYATGRGRITVRARAEVEEENHRIVITEIPYAVNKTVMFEQMADCVKDKRVEGVTAMRDESGRDGMRIVVEYRHDVSGQVILNQFYRLTQLQDTFAVNMLALVDNIPKLLPLREAIAIYIRHQEDVIIRRTRFELDDAQKEAHINEGFKFAIDNIDQVIAVIRASSSVQEAKVNLIAAFTADKVENFLEAAGAEHNGTPTGLSDAQAQAIVEMPLGRLAGMERAKIDEHLSELYAKIRELEEILADESRVKDIIRTELGEIRKRFSDERRTEILPIENELEDEDLIRKHTCAVTLTDSGYIKRVPITEYKAQNRAGGGMRGASLKEEDGITSLTVAPSHGDLLLLTNCGRMQRMRTWKITEKGRTDRGTHMANLIDLTEGERVTTVLPVPDEDEGLFLTLITRMGEVRVTKLEEFRQHTKTAKKCYDLNEGDELLGGYITREGDTLLIATTDGRAVRFALDSVTVRSRTAGGVRAIELPEGARVAGAVLTDETRTLLTVTENGYGKRTAFSEFPVKGRGGKGMLCHALTEKTGRLAALTAVGDEDELMMMTNDGQIIRIHNLDALRSDTGRATQGVILMKTGDAKIVNLAVLTAEVLAEPEEDAEEPDEEEELALLEDYDDGADENAPDDDEI